jgi:uncharacterized phage protein (TIGR02218 family)
MLTFLGGDVRTIATLWKIVRTDGNVFGYTDHDQDIVFTGLRYKSSIGYTASAIDSTSDMSTSNLEINALLDNFDILESDIEGGLWNNAAVTIMLVNFMDLTMGSVTMNSGVIGQFNLGEGTFTAEVRSLSQIMQQQLNEVYSPMCRASLGDSRCLIDLAPLTFTGVAVTSVTDNLHFGASSLTQVGPTVEYIDSTGEVTPTTGPCTIQVVPPTGGAFVANSQVKDNLNIVFTDVSPAAPSQTGEYSWTDTGLYTFYNGSGTGDSNAGQEMFINYTYSIGFFAYGYLKFTSGQNAGYVNEIRAFAPGEITLGLPMPYPVEPGDEFTIVAGCDRSLGTCIGRFNNIIHFRGEPYVPGTDTIYKSQAVTTTS